MKVAYNPSNLSSDGDLTPTGSTLSKVVVRIFAGEHSDVAMRDASPNNPVGQAGIFLPLVIRMTL